MKIICGVFFMKGFFVLFFVAIIFFGCSGKKDEAVVEGTEVFESHYPSGQIEAKGQFVNGTMSGAWISWHENGQKQREENYLDDKFNNRKIDWYENGQLKEYAWYKEGRLHGRKTNWDESGKVLSDIEYAEGKEVKVYFRSGIDWG
jgi:antitoxin component YwqK of YwqJK toxin-antitoxin module